MLSSLHQLSTQDLFIKMEPTVVGGIAHAQSLHKLPCKQALPTSAGEHSVVPIHIICESTSRITCKARAGSDGSDDARYRVSTDAMALVDVEILVTEVVYTNYSNVT